MSGSNRVLNLLLSAGSGLNLRHPVATTLCLATALGYNIADLLSFSDSENHRPLHSSVIGI